MPHTPFKTEKDDQLQAVLFHGRERRASLAGIPELFRTHQFFGGTSMPVAEILTATVFPNATLRPITFKTAIRITADGTQAAEHRGLVFEFGGTGRGFAVWVGDQTIGLAVGQTTGGATVAEFTFDNGAVFTDGAEFELVVAANPGNGKARMWANGTEVGRATATNGNFNGAWAGTNQGSFAATFAGGQVHGGVPAISQIAPDGFAVIEPLSAYVGQIPRHFV